MYDELFVCPFDHCMFFCLFGIAVFWTINFIVTIIIGKYTYTVY